MAELTSEQVQEARRLDRQIGDAIEMLMAAKQSLPMYVFERPMNREEIASNLEAGGKLAVRLANEVLPLDQRQ